MTGAGDTLPCVARFKTFIVSTFTAIVFIFVNDQNNVTFKPA